MNNVIKDIFRAIFLDKWISIEYINKNNETTKYWIGVKKIVFNEDIFLIVQGLHVGMGCLTELKIDLKAITFSKVIEGSYFKVDEQLKQDIENNPEKYQRLFNNVTNLRILNYLIDCSRLDNVPYKKDYALISKIDDSKVKNGLYILNQNQYLEVIRSFQKNIKKEIDNNTLMQLCINILSIHTNEGLYVLAYRKLNFDVENKCFRADNEIHVSTEFNINGDIVKSIRYFIDSDDLYLLDDFYNNLSIIEDKIDKRYQVDDVPYIIAISRDMNVSLEYEYASIEQMYQENTVSIPIKAFFGELVKLPERRKNYPITLIDKNINLDQLLAIHNAIKYPITYVQGPPGTGKTNTIINTILTAYFNDKKVLFSSYNNHPIDSVMEKLQKMSFDDQIIPFPILRVGNNEIMNESINSVKNMISFCDEQKVKYEGILEYNLKNNSKQLTDLMRRYEEITELTERKETIEKLLETTNDFNFQLTLQTKQLNDIKQRLEKIGKITNEDALGLIVENNDFKKHLFNTSIKRIQKLKEPKYSKLIEILNMEESDERVISFNKYLSDDNNIEKLLDVFPIITSTCISSHKIGRPKRYFDMTIMDEASQCNIACSLIPIIRGESLMLVGDPQQLNPVIVLDKVDNNILMKKYDITKEYDYLNNSIYKTYLAADSLSNEILLSHHYRCDQKIIEFCNKKYYNNRLSIDTKNKADKPLLFVDVKNNESTLKNTSQKEIDLIVEYVIKHPEKSIGIITPFVKQKDAIEQRFKENNINNVSVGTVHAFQGDEKDEIIFSLAITNKTSKSTYNWLKNNKELINVGVSRAKKRLIILSSDIHLNRLHANGNERDDIYELIEYAKTNGASEISLVPNKSRALGIKPYSSETEEAFLQTLNHALGNILKSDKKCEVKKEVAIASIFTDNINYSSLFYSGRFDFVVFETVMNQQIPILAIELDGKEHYNDEVVKKRDKRKNEICSSHGFELIRIDNSYARRYNYIKNILIDYFEN